jgi:CheY-like chemotaxis protein
MVAQDLGLTIVKQLVELQDGSINVYSKENEGSTFHFLQFLTKSERLLWYQKPDSHKPKSSEQLKYASILLVEDNDINRLYAGSILKMWGCHFETAENGVVALEKIRGHDFDLILMDIQMPVMDGFETTKAIRQGDQKKSKVPIIALTANATQRDFEKCIATGMNDCITKPFTQDDLFKTLTKYLGKKLTIKKKITPQEVKPVDAPIDLAYLKKVSNNNQEFIQEIVNTFLGTIPTTISDINLLVQEKNWVQLGKVIHKIKPTVTLMGIHHIKDKIQQLEHETKDGYNEELMTNLSKEVSHHLTRAVDSLSAKA